MRLLAAFASVLLGMLGLCASAFAAVEEPETPLAQAPSEVRATHAVLHGTLNPGKSGEAGTFELDSYEFVYRPSTKDECLGSGQQVTMAGMSLGGGDEEVPAEPITGLSAGTQYAVCLIVHNSAIPDPEAPSGEKAVEVAATSAKLEGILDPTKAGEAGTYQFAYGTESGECAENGSFAYSPEPAGSMTGAHGQPVAVELTGLRPATSYTFCLAATNGAGDAGIGPEMTFKTATAAPAVGEAATPSVAVGSATVTAEITANGLATDYQAEYVSDLQYQTSEWAQAARFPSPAADLPAANVPVSVSERLSGLEADTVYHIRYTATNATGSTSGSAATFTVPAATTNATAPPDGRVDELVSNTASEGEREGEPYLPPTQYDEFNAGIQTTELPFQVASSGEAVAYVGEPAFSTGNGSVGPGNGNQWLARRTPTSWSAEDITLPGSSGSSLFEGFSSDLTTSFLEGQLGRPATEGVSPECIALYSRVSATGALGPLFTEGVTSGNCGHPLFAGASAGNSQILVESEAALTRPAVEATALPPSHSGGHEQENNQGEPCTFGCNLYDYTGGDLTLVSELEGKPVPNATFGGYVGEQTEGTDLSGAISSDGSRIFWTDTEEGPDLEHVFVLENGTTTVQVSGAGAAEYWTATPDGEYAYYTEGGGLWRFDTQTNTREELANAGADVQGVIGTSEDGSYLYFVAEGALAPGATPKSCPENEASLMLTENANSEQEEDQENLGCNLYVRHEGRTQLVAVLSPLDDFTEGLEGNHYHQAGDWRPYLGQRVAEVAPDGRSLIFQSLRALTHYDNSIASSRIIEAFVYAAKSGSLVCASCDPAGAPPKIGGEQHESKLTAGFLNATSEPRWISNNGNRAFFQTLQPLVPQDTNEAQDVYEWEREGEGTCAAQTPARLDGGCTFLLSGGVERTDSFLVGADEMGNNVFFEHVGPLGEVQAPADQNEVYDARVGGGFSQTSTACTGTGCQGVPPAPPSFATPASATFSGGGNYAATPVTTTVKKAKTPAQIRKERLAAALKACRRDRVRSRRAKCERRARAKYGVKKPKRAKKAATRVGYERRAGA